MIALPKRFERWTIESHTTLFVVVRCDCGTRRTIRKSTWIAQNHLNKRCRRCLIREAVSVHRWLFPKHAAKTKGAGHGQSRRKASSANVG